MKLSRRNYLISTILLLVIGLVCLAIEYGVYQTVDENGYLQESLFLPVGAICVLLGAGGILALLLRKLCQWWQAR